MYRLIQLTKVREAEWEQFAREHGTTFHSLAWAGILERVFGYRSTPLILLDEADRIAALLPLMICRNLRLRRVAVSLPFVNYLDLCCRDEAALTALLDSLAALPARYGAEHLELRLMTQASALERAGVPASVERSNATFVLRLDVGEERLLADCKPSHRNHVRKTYRRGSFSAQSDGSDLDEFYRVYSKRQKELGTPVPSIEFYRGVRAAFPQQAIVLTVRESEQNRVIAGMFLLGSRDTLHYLWGGGEIEYNRQHVNAFMYWEAIRCAIARGYRNLDLGRSPHAADHSGAFGFKLQFGVDPTPLAYCRIGAGAARKAANDRAGFAAAASVWKRLPAALTGPLGRLLIRYVIP